MSKKFKVRAAELTGDPWESSIALSSVDDGRVVGTVRPVREGDEALLTTFGRECLSDDSRTKFECYRWMSEELTAELQAAIKKSIERRDLHLLAVDSNSVPIGYIFLWAATDKIPELGLAVADTWHGYGVGLALLGLMEKMGRTMGRQALELTTMQVNKRALAVYLKAGWQHLGLIHNPLGCDVPAAFECKATPTGIAIENHCVLILDETKRETTLAQLNEKRERSVRLFPAQQSATAEATFENWNGEWAVDSRVNWDAWLEYMQIPEEAREGTKTMNDLHKYIVTADDFIMEHIIEFHGHRAQQLHFRAQFKEEWVESPYPLTKTSLWKEEDHKPHSGKPGQWRNTWLDPPTKWEALQADFNGLGKTVRMAREMQPGGDSFRIELSALDPQTETVVAGPSVIIFKRLSNDVPTQPTAL